MNRKTVLLVDDEPAVRRNFRALLEDSGHGVVEADNGREGLVVFARENPDLVLTDLRMPLMGGLDLIARLKEQSPDTPVVAVSGTGTLHDVITAMRTGAWDYVVKPMQEAEELEIVTRRCLERARLLVENRRYRGCLEDMVEQRTRALRESEERIRSIASNLPGVVLQFYARDNGDVGLNYASERSMEILGLELEAPDGLDRLIAGVAPEDTQRFVASMREAVRLQSRWEFEGRFFKATGEEIHVRCISRPRQIDGELLFDGMLLDVTEQKKLEDQLLRAQRVESVSRLASGVAHDLNNVLAPILMASDMIRSETTSPAQVGLLDVIISSTGRGANIVKQLLQFSRGAAGGVVDLNLCTLIRETVRMLRETFPRSISIESDLAEDLWQIRGDATQIQQVLLNLCINARDAIVDGGEIVLEAENVLIGDLAPTVHPDARPGPYVVLRVKDTGSGIAPEIMDRIFDPFFTTKEVGHGTGLGLSSVSGIVNAHAGFVQVQTQAGQGTQFEIFLPAQQSRVSVASEKPVGSRSVGGGERILVVDDDDALRKVTGTFLERHGYRVLQARDGYEALALYARQKEDIHAVMVDMWMPYMDGMETIRQLQRVNPRVRIIAASGLPGLQAQAEAAGPAVRAVLAKPWSSQQLLETLAGVLGRDPVSLFPTEVEDDPGGP